MRFLRRSGDATHGGGIDAFWSWWAGASRRYAEALGRGHTSALADEMTERVHAIHRQLEWEFGRGERARFGLTVTPGGDPEVRPVALAWLAAAPSVDDTWEYHASRQPTDPADLGALEIGGAAVALEAMRGVAGWDDLREMLDVRLWHPAFPDLAEDVRRQVMFLFLDALLGEDAVERWIGTIEALPEPVAGRTPDELRAEVERQAATATGDVWAVVERTDRGGSRALVTANMALKRIDHPAAMHHLTVTFERGFERLSGDHAELERLNQIEDGLDRELAGMAVPVGRVTEARRRVLHYVCDEPERAGAVARAVAVRHRDLGARVDVARDPRWEFRRELAG